MVSDKVTYRQLALGRAIEQELQRRGGLARARLALQQVQAVGRQAAAQDGVKPRRTSRNAVCDHRLQISHRFKFITGASLAAAHQ